MGPQARHDAEGEPLSAPPREADPRVANSRFADANYRRLLATLASRARKFGSRDPESAAQETLRRSLENVNSQPAVAYYFADDPPGNLPGNDLPGNDLPEGVAPPAWALDQLLAWLHGVLRYVVREEQNRASYRREFSREFAAAPHLDPVDPMPDQLDTLLHKELQGIVAGCFPKLDREYQTVLRMRVDGMKYSEIADRLKISENTVATWVSRGVRALAQCVRRRTERVTSFPQTPGRGNPRA